MQLRDIFALAGLYSFCSLQCTMVMELFTLHLEMMNVKITTQWVMFILKSLLATHLGPQKTTFACIVHTHLEKGCKSERYMNWFLLSFRPL